MSLASMIFEIFHLKKFPLFKSTNSVVFKLETAMFQ